MLDYLVMIPTFNRGDLLARVLEKLRVEALRTSFSYRVLLWNDGSTSTLGQYASIDRQFCQKTTSTFEVTHHRYKKNRGRKGFWKTLTELMGLAKQEEFRYAIMMPDDCLPCNDFFNRITDRFTELQAEDELYQVVAMNLICTLLRNWGEGRYLDNVYIADRRFFDALDWQLRSSRGHWSDNPRSGSGTGHQITQRLAKNKSYRVAPNQDCSWLKPMEVKSVMFSNDTRPLVWWRDNYVGDE